MNKLLFLVLFTISAFANSQGTNQIKVILNGTTVISFDSVFINPNSVKEIIVDKDSSPRIVYITTKEHEWKFKTIKDVLDGSAMYNNIFVFETVKPVVYINDLPINKISDAKIDQTYFTEFSFKDLSGFKSLGIGCKDIVVIEIKLSTTEIKKTIRIRGNDLCCKIDSTISEK